MRSRTLFLSVLLHAAVLAGAGAFGLPGVPRGVDVQDDVRVQWRASQPALPECVEEPVPAPPLAAPVIEPIDPIEPPLAERGHEAEAAPAAPEADAVRELAARTFAGVGPARTCVEPPSASERTAGRELGRRFPRTPANDVAAAPPPAVPATAVPAVAAAAAAEPAEAAFVDAVGDASRNRAPAYPDEARFAGVEGVVRVGLTIDATGSVTDARVLRSSGHRALDRAAVRALRAWRFAPARRDGVAVATTLEQSVVFRLLDVAN